jgi:hypothetical protein
MPSAVKYPNDRTNPVGAIPVFLVSTPNPGPPWPNQRTNGAIPVNFVPVGTSPNSGPIPVVVVAGVGTPPFGNDQGNSNNAIPVYISGEANAMPVWDTAPAPPPIPVNTTPPSITPTGTLNSGTLLTVNTGVWTNNPLGFDIQWTRNNTPIVGANALTYMTTVIDRNNNIGATVAADNDGGRSLPEPSSNTVAIAGPPANVIPPAISPVGPVDFGTTLSMSTGAWTNNPTNYFYGWTRNGSSISGANTSQYTTVQDDSNTVIGGVAQASNAVGGGIAVATSNQVTVNPPEPAITPATFNVSLPVINSQIIGTCVATNSPNAWALVETGDTPSGLFGINGSGEVSVANESLVVSGTYTYTLYAQNNLGIGEPSTCTINVT